MASQSCELLSLTMCAECKLVNKAMADDNSTDPGSRMSMYSTQPGQTEVTPWVEINYTAWQNCEWNNISFTDACVVVWLSHQAGISRQSLTVISVRGTSSHRNYQMDLQYLRSLTRKHHQTDQTKSKNHLTFFFILGINHGWLSVNWTSRAGYNWTLIGDNATHFQLTFG